MIRLFFTFTDNAVAVSKQDGIPYIIKTFFHYHICDKFKGGLKHLEILLSGISDMLSWLSMFDKAFSFIFSLVVV